MTGGGYDVVVVGAGIVGLATARALLASRPGTRLAVIEKEAAVGRHQTGHNSGVIHGGIYYKPGSLKARLCVEGARRMMTFCDDHGLRYERCGKVIVAVDERELPQLDELERRGLANGVPSLRRVGGDELRAIEPYAAGIAGLHSPNTAIVDYGQVARAMADDLRHAGAELKLRCAVRSIRHDGGGLRLATTDGDVAAEFMVNCAGLHADTIAVQAGADVPARIVPFRGEYYFLRPERQHLVRGLIYPVPDPELPFLGVHLTRSVHGDVEAGPNAVLAFAREGYTRRTFNPRDLADMARFAGFWRMARAQWRTALSEYRRSLSPELFAASLRGLAPAIRREDLVAGGAGVRAQAIGRDGRLIDDFLIVRSPRALHILNAPSPAATASLAIGDYIAAQAQQPTV